MKGSWRKDEDPEGSEKLRGLGVPSRQYALRMLIYMFVPTIYALAPGQPMSRGAGHYEKSHLEPSLRRGRFSGGSSSSSIPLRDCRLRLAYICTWEWKTNYTIACAQSEVAQQIFRGGLLLSIVPTGCCKRELFDSTESRKTKQKRSEAETSTIP